jgi:hypothetical protein
MPEVVWFKLVKKRKIVYPKPITKEGKVVLAVYLLSLLFSLIKTYLAFYPFIFVIIASFLPSAAMITAIFALVVYWTIPKQR